MKTYKISYEKRQFKNNEELFVKVERKSLMGGTIIAGVAICLFENEKNTLKKVCSNQKKLYICIR